MKEQLDKAIAIVSNKGVFFPCLLGYFVGFLMFGLIMGLGFVAAAITHFLLYYSQLE